MRGHEGARCFKVFSGTKPVRRVRVIPSCMYEEGKSGLRLMEEEK